jgi:hypothetical protein
MCVFYLLHIYEGCYKSDASFFFLRNCNYNYKEIYICHGYVLYKIGVIFLRLLIINTVFPLLRETFYAGCVKLFAGTSELFMHTVFQLVVCKRCLQSASFRELKRQKLEGAKARL